jgi:two-component system nitrogen regulation response regulator GlnG
MTAEALLEIKKRKWPGNVRQLKNAVEHAAILAQHQQIQPEHLPPDIDIYSNQSNPDTLDRMIGQWVADQLKSTAEENLHEQFLARVEPILLRLVLEANKGQKQPSARMLGIHRATLRQMLRKYDVGDEN